MTTIYVWLEHVGGKLVNASREALGAAKTLGGSVTGVVFGQGIDEVVQQAFSYGVDSVIKSDHASLENFRFEPYVSLLAKVVQDGKPDAVLAGHTTRGREILSGVSADLDAPLITDAMEIKLEGGKLQATRPVYDGKVVSRVEVTGEGVQLATLREGAFAAPAPKDGASGNVSSVDPVLPEDQIATKVESFAASTSTVNLTNASRIVSGGRGIGGPEGFEPLKELASTLDAALGASRAAVDAGWIPYDHQIGQTGKDVSPDLYIAVGISGAIQHVSGMRTAKAIVAINKDPEAPIFSLADYGIVDDLFKVVPELTKAFKERLGK